ncbi:alpha/beta-Hydrolase [Glarea lozoyensis ATCC 20868]|uniref:Alpha/beta-Hydrolase n=1 Tax=Glarea lozoyensis (strain ATCC 20868 / MF5171) TaxID=1116229 RepID=S3DCR8_GLAL2|nr:alpha/beta-Hydrolase [Glarea lozoyensis ATCC 20868]EPE35530.1 alpha/beta-Hydrolase [Glarea lozoyensis ATCC 20868]
MIGTSKPEYYFILVCIIGLHYLAPIALLYTLINLILHGFNIKATAYGVPLIIEIIAVAESLFFLCVFLPYKSYLQREAKHPNPPSRDEREELFRLCNENISDPEVYLRKWFLGAELEDIRKDNVKEFFLWAFFNRGGPPGDDEDELDEMVSATETLLGQPIEDGRGSAKCLRLTLDEVKMLHRSLVWYMCVGFVDFLTYMKLLYHGFHFHRTKLTRFFTLFPFRWQSLFTKYHSPAKHTTYWHRPHTSTTRLPVVFVHGIGIGYYPYTNFLNEINSTAGLGSNDPNEQIGIIAIEIMPVAFRITHHALSKDELCAEIDQILLQHFSPSQKFVLASHSYGTVISTHLLKTPSIAKRIGPILLVDPVSFLLHLPDVAYNFTRRQPKHANEHQLYYFASMDIGVSHTLSRHFFWNENIIWKKDLEGRKVTASLSGKDLIVDTLAVGRYLGGRSESTFSGYTDEEPEPVSLDRSDSEPSLLRLRGGGADSVEPHDDWKYRTWKGTGIEVMWHKDLDHAQVFDNATCRRKLISVLRAYCESG